MATIYLDNLIKPRESNDSSTVAYRNPSSPSFVYKDLSLDLNLQKNLGVNKEFASSDDINVDLDSLAIRNSVYNILTTRQGWKILSPSFGSRLDTFLFEAVTDFRAKSIGDYIYNQISKYEPRISLVGDKHSAPVTVIPDYDNNAYQITIRYKITDSGILDVLNLNISSLSTSPYDSLVIYGKV